MQKPHQFLQVLGNELLHMTLNEEYVRACMHVNILTLITDKMSPLLTFTHKLLVIPAP